MAQNQESPAPSGFICEGHAAASGAQGSEGLSMSRAGKPTAAGGQGQFQDCDEQTDKSKNVLQVARHIALMKR